VGLIGANVSQGWAPRAHVPAILALPEIELAAVCTAHESTAREAAEKFGARMAFHDHREMLERDDIDAVAVLVRVPKHHRLTMDALAAGKHVFTEWPLGATLAEAEEMAGLARARGVRTMVGLQARCAPAWLRLRELVREGYVGELLACHMARFSAGVLTRTSGRTWQGDRTLGATNLSIMFGHSIDALAMCLGELAEVSALVRTQVPQWLESDTGRMVDVTNPDNMLLDGTLEGGAVVSAHVAAIPWHDDGFRLQVYGREGTIVATGPENPQIGRVRLSGGRKGDPGLEELPIPERLTWVPEAVPEGPAFNVAQMWSRFAESIRTGERAEPDFDTAVTRHQLLEAVQRASDTGQRQDLR
jgi:predicted dehydrogenase